VIVPLNSNEASGAVGSVGFTVGAELSGVSVVGSVGAVGVGDRVIALTGVSARGAAGNVIANYWKVIDDSQASSWQNVATAQTDTWALIDDSQPNTWELVDATT
jgi:hypothetical protein